ncbi:MAG: YdeI/OmpD-associated family protein [Deltaproteobacteria bacterium]|nr:YdeI/OmpD-associated family protein [Deltaproteobacteria bacterium]
MADEETLNESETMRLPLQLLKALAGSPGASAAFENLPIDEQRQSVDWVIEGATAEERERRADEIIAKLKSEA